MSIFRQEYAVFRKNNLIFESIIFTEREPRKFSNKMYYFAYLLKKSCLWGELKEVNKFYWNALKTDFSWFFCILLFFEPLPKTWGYFFPKKMGKKPPTGPLSIVSCIKKVCRHVPHLKYHENSYFHVKYRLLWLFN